MPKLILFPYLGGKYRLASKLIRMFPHHTTYVEVFGGAASCLLQKPSAKVEVYNDINSDIVNLFRVLRSDFEEFYRLVKFTAYSREEFYAYCKHLKTESDPLQRAVLWYSVQCQLFAGIPNSNYWDGCRKARNGARSFKNKVDNLPYIVDRLRATIIENAPFEKVMEAYDMPDTFFYLDPPYLPETRRGGEYQNEMTYEDHERLISHLQKIEGNVMLSAYQNELYETLEWERVDFQTTAHSAGRTRNSGLQGEGNVKKKQKRVESVYMNYTLPETLRLL